MHRFWIELKNGFLRHHGVKLFRFPDRCLDQLGAFSFQNWEGIFFCFAWCFDEPIERGRDRGSQFGFHLHRITEVGVLLTNFAVVVVEFGLEVRQFFRLLFLGGLQEPPGGDHGH